MTSAKKNINFNKSTAEVNLQADPIVLESITDSVQFSDANQNILSDIFMPFWNEINAEEDSTRGFRKEEQKIELERVKQEIVKIISQKENFNKENEVLKIYQLAFSQLNEQNTNLKERIQTLEASNHTDQNDGSSISELLIENAVNSIIDIDRSSPDGQEKDNKHLSLPSQSIELKNGEIFHLEERIKILETEKSSLETERKELLEKHQWVKHKVYAIV